MADRSATLAYAGALPFVAGAALAVTGVDPASGLGPAPLIVAAWALTIVSFMAGVHWGQYLAAGEEIGINLFLTSNAIAITGWLAFLLLPVSRALLVFAALFAILLLIDRRLRKADHIAPGYWRTRVGVTAIVIVSLLVTAAFA
ncbi:DUF3429 domain-containing protein [Parasphingopyxis algicola]|uniref:DUF3429 domain-containing protein n=1 Tax=Parasphingopyxis algicola TaxID=2026624 RepID=UPI0015A0E532|nr:DUF3429 domain-containing protein [Parasphingopyxis algicola]QLC25933.1 DUF3429 domain-containing protein [Parasphingopyxis algicola]